MQDEQPNEPLIPVRPVQQKPQQQPKKPQQQPRQNDDVSDFREQIRRSIVNIEASASVQDDTITQLSIAVHEVIDSQNVRQKAVMNAILKQQETTELALLEAQKMMRFMVAKLNERPVSRTWTPQRIVILTVVATVVAFALLVWHG